MKLATLRPLLRMEGVFWVSLQKGEAAAQLRELLMDVAILDGSSGYRNLAETAALLAMLDLVITTDTCIAHLAGAMGKPVWILLPHLADWRWMEKVETTPWYPTARLFRQQSSGDWAGMLERVSAEICLFRSQWPEAEISRPGSTPIARERAA
ncbi:MAG: glycosyltransferase family 9 protein [Terracidiphilus sp.]